MRPHLSRELLKPGRTVRVSIKNISVGNFWAPAQVGACAGVARPGFFQTAVGGFFQTAVGVWVTVLKASAEAQPATQAWGVEGQLFGKGSRASLEPCESHDLIRIASQNASPEISAGETQPVEDSEAGHNVRIYVSRHCRRTCMGFEKSGMASVPVCTP